jgi:hypothetical protein
LINRWRSSMLLLGMCVVAMLIGVLRLATDHPQVPSSSSYSADLDGTLALYTWLSETAGVPTQRLTDVDVPQDVSTLLIIEPENVIDRATRQAFDNVADRGGTLVLAGDSVQWLVYARELGVTVDPAATPKYLSTPDGLRLPPYARFSLSAPDAEPILVRDDGEAAGLRMPYRQGTLVVIASSLPFSNGGLGDDATARFVFRTLVGPLASNPHPIAFDEIDRSLPDATGPDQATLNTLLFRTPPGQAIIYVALLTFAYLVLAGRRLGPPLVEPAAEDSRRTMHEHVQMLADLYRRAGQFGVLKSSLVQHYSRVLARSATRTDAASQLERLQSARSESDLLAAVAAFDDAR